MLQNVRRTAAIAGILTFTFIFTFNYSITRSLEKYEKWIKYQKTLRDQNLGPVPIETSDGNLCPRISPLMIGRQALYTKVKKNDAGDVVWPLSYEQISAIYPQLEEGGFYQGPSDCEPRSTIAIIIPQRDRETHLRFFLQYTHGLLQRQQLRYVIFVAQQDDREVFNKGQLMNTAFTYATTNFPRVKFDCFFFHDVDVISEDDRTVYSCRDEKHVNHVAALLNKYNYTVCCGITVGAVLGMTETQFKKINGYSNSYYGWGGEDDDMFFRIGHIGKFLVYRPLTDHSRFFMIEHDADTKNPKNGRRHKVLYNWKPRYDRDGLNTLRSNITRVAKYPTHTTIFIRPSPANKEIFQVETKEHVSDDKKV